MKTCAKPNCYNPIWSHKFCKYHQHLRTDKDKPISPLLKTKLKHNASGEGILFASIINSRPHISFISGLDIFIIDGTITHSNCHHVLPKGQYPDYRLLDKNIILITKEEHNLVHAGTEKLREAYSKRILAENGLVVDWNKLYQLKEKLKLEYENL